MLAPVNAAPVMGSKHTTVGKRGAAAGAANGAARGVGGETYLLLAFVTALPILSLIAYTNSQYSSGSDAHRAYSSDALALNSPAFGGGGGTNAGGDTTEEAKGVETDTQLRGALHSLLLQAGGVAHASPSQQAAAAKAVATALDASPIISETEFEGAETPGRNVAGTTNSEAGGGRGGSVSTAGNVGSSAHGTRRKGRSVELPPLPSYSPAASVNQEAIDLERRIASAFLAIKAGPAPGNKNPPGSSKNHPLDPWTKTVEKPLTAPTDLDFKTAAEYQKNVVQNPSMYGPRKRLLVCLFTGGDPGFRTATDQVDRVAAVERAWADTDVYWVTRRDDVDLARRIRLPDEAETGGYKKIWKKSLHLFHYLTHTKLGLQYDYIFKGDDDTFVNLAEMREVLGSFDPAIPAQYGNNLYGVGCRGAAPAPPFYWQNRGIDSCHGGAGYAISRGAMEIAAEHWLGCATEWPGSSYEDATVAFCLMRHVGIQCFGMKNEFGWDRYHNTKRERVPEKLDLLEKLPIRYAAATTFHPVPPDFQSRIAASIKQFRGSHLEDVKKNRAKILGKVHRGYVAQWNCTSEDAMPPINAICQQYATLDPPLGFKPRVVGAKVKKLPVLWDPAPRAGDAGVHRAPTDAVIVVLDETLTPDNPVANPERSLLLLVLSLRKVNAKAKLILFADSATAKMVPASVRADAFVELVPMTSRGGGAEGALPGYAGLGTMIASFLRERGSEFNKIALLAGSAVLFQANPFDGNLPLHANGVSVFVTDTYPTTLTDYNTDVAEVFRWMGVCSARDRNNVDMAASRAKSKAEPRVGADLFRGPGLIETGILFGSSLGLQTLLTEFVYDFTSIAPVFRRVCAPRQSISRLVWTKQAAERVPLIVPAVSANPVVNLGAGDGTTWRLSQGTIKNRNDHSATVVLTSGTCLCCSADESKRDGYVDAGGRTGVPVCPTAALELMSLLAAQSPQ